MKKLQKRDWQFRGEITAFLSLIFILMLSVVATLFSSASLQVEKSSRRAKMNVALESVFAEYHKGMLENYDLFVRAGCDERIVESRLQYYGMTDMQQTITKAELLTDKQGLPYYQQAVRYVKKWLGLDGAMSGGSSSDFETDSSLDLLEKETANSLSDLLAQGEATLPEENNPLGNIQNLKKSSLLSILVPNPENLSYRSLNIENLPSKRSLNKGTGSFENAEGEGGIAEKTLFVAYLFEHFSDAAQERNWKSLSYELEYILCGNSVDSENLEAVLQKILKLRMALNYAYLQTDETRKAEAQLMAAGLCSLIQVPGITQVVKQAILLAWSYGESIVDLRVLMQQDKVPIWKTSQSWQLQLSNLGKLGTNEEVSGAKSAETGLDYQDYLKGFLLLEDRNVLCMRSLDLIESNLSVKTDECMTRVEIKSNYKLREEVWDSFFTEFKYE